MYLKLVKRVDLKRSHHRKKKKNKHVFFFLFVSIRLVKEFI